MDFSIVIISFNTKNLLVECLKSIIRSMADQKFKYEIIVVDNASKDGTVTAIKNYNLKIIQNKQNLGFSKANNIGVKHAAGKYILFLNPDTIIYKGSIEKIIDFMENNKGVGAATCKILLPNGELDDACHRGFPTPWSSLTHFTGLSKIFPKSKLFSGYNLGGSNLNEIHQIDACCGAFVIVRREAGEEIGWWDEDFFWYGEDLDFCYRLKRKGWRVYFVPTCKILHHKGVSGGIKSISKYLTKADEETRRKATKARFEAMRIFYKKHYEKIYPWFVNHLIYFGIWIKERLTSI